MPHERFQAIYAFDRHAVVGLEAASCPTDIAEAKSLGVAQRIARALNQLDQLGPLEDTVAELDETLLGIHGDEGVDEDVLAAVLADCRARQEAR